MNNEIWIEVIEEAMNECKLEATQEQIECIASGAEGMHENYGTYTGADVRHSGENPEIARLKNRIKELEAERDGIRADYKLNVARRWNTSTSDVILLGGGDAEIRGY